MNVFVHFPVIICKSGLSVSIQASEGHYCKPREDSVEVYTAVELGFPSHTPPEYLLEYAETAVNDEPDYENTVYAYVPVALVERWIQEEGGIDLGKTIARWNKAVNGKILSDFS